MKIRYLFITTAFLLAGCSLNTNVDLITEENTENTSVSQEISSQEESVTASETEIETTTTVSNESEETTDNSIIIETSTPAYERIEDMELPVDENLTWLEYGIVNLGQYKDVWEANFEDEFGPMGVTFILEPLYFIGHSDEAVRDPINEKIIENARMNYWERFQMRDLKLDIKCRLTNSTSRFLSYHFEGMIYHIGDDTRYQDEKEYLYYMTIDRMTGDALGIDTVYGLDKALEDIRYGNYEIVRGNDNIQERFTNDLLAEIYKNEPLFDDDTEHKRDFYLDDEKKLNVVIWVGDDNGSYLILRLNGDVILIDKKDKSIVSETTEDATIDESGEETIEETIEETAEEQSIE